MFWGIISDTTFLAYVPTARICYWGKVTMIRQTARTGHVRNVCETNNDADESKLRPLQWYMTFPLTRECQWPEQGLPALRWGSLCPKATGTWQAILIHDTSHVFFLLQEHLPTASLLTDWEPKSQATVCHFFSRKEEKRLCYLFSFSPHIS